MNFKQNYLTNFPLFNSQRHQIYQQKDFKMGDEQWKPLVFREFNEIFNELSDTGYMDPSEYLNSTDESVQKDDVDVNLSENNEILNDVLRPYGSHADGDTEDEIAVMLKQAPGVVASDSKKIGKHDAIFNVLDQPVLNSGKIPILLDDKYFTLSHNRFDNDDLLKIDCVENYNNESKTLEERFPTCFPKSEPKPAPTVRNQPRRQIRARLSNLGDIRMDTITVLDSDDDDDVKIVSVTKGTEKSRSSRSDGEPVTASDFSSNESSASTTNKQATSIQPKYYTPREIYLMKRKKD